MTVKLPSLRIGLQPAEVHHAARGLGAHGRSADEDLSDDGSPLPACPGAWQPALVPSTAQDNSKMTMVFSTTAESLRLMRLQFA